MLTLACGHPLRLTTQPRLPEDSYANQTCAYCEPKRRLKILHTAYENHHSVLMHRYLEAKKRGDVGKMDRLEDDMKEAIKTFKEAISTVTMSQGREGTA